MRRIIAIARCAAGNTKLIVPFPVIKDILKPGSILVNFK